MQDIISRAFNTRNLNTVRSKLPVQSLRCTELIDCFIVAAPLRDIVEYRADFWNLTLGQRTEYTQSPNDEVDAAWNRISAPPGDGA